VKHILAVLGVTIGLLLFFFLLSYKEISYYMKQSFYSNAIVIVNSFESEVLIGNYTPSDNMKYVMLSKLRTVVSDNTFYPESSYIALKQEKGKTSYYLTLLGKGRYAFLAYKNTLSTKLNDFSNIVTSGKINVKKLLKEIKAEKY
jgi:hypothetical protein